MGETLASTAPAAQALGGRCAAPGAPVLALLFDLDGTLIDSMPLHERSWQLWFAEQDLPFDEAGFFEATAGRTNFEILSDLLPARPIDELHRLAFRKEELYREIAATELSLIAGAAEFCAAARAQGYKLAVCTASPRENIAVAFDRFRLGDLVDTVTSPSEIKFGGAPGETLRGKPHPDIFAEAARRLGVPAEACLVYEDAPLGIEAARRAGMCAVALTTTLPASAFADYTNVVTVMNDFVGYSLPALGAARPVR
jgi:beta-phosphoglucomutase-like phosphatase (HAD superfamily)